MEKNVKPLTSPPIHCIVPNTFFTVDWHSKTFPEYIHSFLSHSHSDHLTGIGSFRSPRILHCTEITSKFIKIKFPKVYPSIIIHEFYSPFIIDNVSIELLESNHTPGSSMFLFKLPNGKKILHTGDFRAEPILLEKLSIFSPVDHIYMDCTFATSKLNIPSREICIQFIVDRVNELIKENSLILIGTYTVGKEDLVFEVAKRTNQKVFTDEKRFQGIQTLIDTGWNLNNIFINNPLNAKIHLIGLQNCNQEFSINYANKFGYKSIATFLATGWAGKPYWKIPKLELIEDIRYFQYSVPYSDHCSPEEIIQFVKLMNPIKIISITSHSEKERSKIENFFSNYLRKNLNKKYIDYYFSPINKK